jgi:hypothetical protein
MTPTSGFPGGVGNTQQDPARFASLIDDVEQRLFGTLPDDTWVYPATAGTRPSALSARTARRSAPAAGDRVHVQPRTATGAAPDSTRASAGTATVEPGHPPWRRTTWPTVITRIFMSSQGDQFSM